MTTLTTLTRRNIRLYFSDKTQVFFSLLGALMAIILVLLFLKTMVVDQMTADLGGAATRTQMDHLLDVWLIASASTIASMTTALGAMYQFVEDRETARWRDFLVTPLSRWTIQAGYLLAAVVVSIIMTTAVYGLGTAYCLAQGAPLSWSGVLTGWTRLVLCSFGFTALMGFITAFLRTHAAFTGVSIIVGITSGFLNGTYVTAHGMPSGVADVIVRLPFAQTATFVRDPYTSQAIAALPEPVREGLSNSMWIHMAIGDTTVTAPMVAGVLVAMLVVFSLAAWVVMTRTVPSARRVSLAR